MLWKCNAKEFLMKSVGAKCRNRKGKASMRWWWRAWLVGEWNAQIQWGCDAKKNSTKSVGMSEKSAVVCCHQMSKPKGQSEHAVGGMASCETNVR